MRKISLFLLFFLVVASLLYVFPISVKANPDWLEGWDYRKSHVIENTTGAGTNYPVKIQTKYITTSSKNFGYEILGIYSTLTHNDIRGSLFTVADDGTADSITICLSYQDGYPWAGKAKCAIYFSNHSLVSNGVTEELSPSLTTTKTWYTFNFVGTKPSLVTNTAYVLVVWLEGSTGNPFTWYDTGVTNQGHYQYLVYDGFPDPLVPSHSTAKLSIYCSYTYTVEGEDSGDTVYLNEKCQADFDDVRFCGKDVSGNNAETNLLDICNETIVASDYATFWVELQYDISSVSQTIYVYYGKTDATSVSSITNTMIKGDDGATGSFTEDLKGSATLTHNSGKYKSTEDSTDDAFASGTILSDWSFYAYIREFPVFSGNGNNQVFGLYDDDAVSGFCDTDANIGLKRRFYIVRYDSNAGSYANKIIVVYKNTAGTYYCWTGSAWTTTTTRIATSGTLEMQIWSDGTNLKADILSSGVSIFTSVASIAISSVKAFSSGKCLVWAEPDTDAMYSTQSIDNYFIRKYVSPEPTHGAWGSEETSSIAYVIDLSKTFSFAFTLLTQTSFIKDLTFTPTLSFTNLLQTSFQREFLFTPSLNFSLATLTNYLMNLQFQPSITFINNLQTSFQQVFTFLPSLSFSNLLASTFNLDFDFNTTLTFSNLLQSNYALNLLFQPAFSFSNLLQSAYQTYMTFQPTLTFENLLQSNYAVLLDFLPSMNFSLIRNVGYVLDFVFQPSISFSLDLLHTLSTLVTIPAEEVLPPSPKHKIILPVEPMYPFVVVAVILGLTFLATNKEIRKNHRLKKISKKLKRISRKKVTVAKSKKQPFD